MRMDGERDRAAEYKSQKDKKKKKGPSTNSPRPLWYYWCDPHPDCGCSSKLNLF